MGELQWTLGVHSDPKVEISIWNLSWKIRPICFGANNIVCRCEKSWIAHLKKANLSKGYMGTG